jgi:myo-inositol-1(or 4)-monophosphatase
LSLDLPTGRSGRTALEVAEAAARAAGRVIMEGFHPQPDGERRAPAVSHKGRANIVTDTDQAAERESIAILMEEFPGYNLLAEESGHTAGEGPYTWVVDPLDGTRNFASGVPHFAVNVALANEGESVLGVTYDPVREEIFHATAGQGTFMNGNPIAVSGIDTLAMGVMGFDMGYTDDKAARLLDVLRNLWPGMQALRLMGSAALGMAYVAAGRIESYAHHNIEAWDIAPGLVLVREAGGMVTDVRGERASLTSPGIVAASPTFHKRFMEATADSEWRKQA